MISEVRSIVPMVVSDVSMRVIFFFNDTAPTEIYTLSLHDALPICGNAALLGVIPGPIGAAGTAESLSLGISARDRKSTRLNSSHSQISYAVFCLKKKTRR